MTTIERNVDLSSTAVRSLAEAGGQAKRLFGCSHSKAPLGCIEYLVFHEYRRTRTGHPIDYKS